MIRTQGLAQERLLSAPISLFACAVAVILPQIFLESALLGRRTGRYEVKDTEHIPIETDLRSAMSSWVQVWLEGVGLAGAPSRVLGA